jgi:hypothetical protein
MLKKATSLRQGFLLRQGLGFGGQVGGQASDVLSRLQKAVQQGIPKV